MKKVIPLLLLAVIIMTGCKKRGLSPEGPTDIRIYNATGKLIEDITVTTTVDDSYLRRSHNFGSLADNTYSDYHRFDIAFVKADITFRSEGVTWSTAPTKFRYLTYMGQMRITYKLSIEDTARHLIKIEVTPEGDIDDL